MENTSHQTKPSPGKDAKRRSTGFVAEFLVIVVGVLSALGVDAFVDWLEDRELEEEYVERLLADVEYDLAEIDFAASLARAAIAQLDVLADEERFAAIDDNELLSIAYVAGHSRQIDRSRSTFDEMIYSGRLRVIRSRNLRAALAEYDRIDIEFDGYFDAVDRRFWEWTQASIPFDMAGPLRDQCGEVSPQAPYGEVTTACAVDTPAELATYFREHFESVEGRQMVTYQRYRSENTLIIAGLYRQAAASLKSVLEEELAAL